MPLDVSKYPPNFGALLGSFNGEIAALMKRLETGKIKPSAWEDSFARLLAKYGQAARMLGTGRDELTEAELIKSRSWLNNQLRYLDNFTLVIMSNLGAVAKEYNPAWESRANMYASSTVTEYWEGRTEDLPLPAMPGQGTQCMGNCHCRWEIVWLNKANGDADAYWRLGDAEHCQTCEVRAEMWNPIRIRGGDLYINQPAPKPLKTDGFGETIFGKDRPVPSDASLINERLYHGTSRDALSKIKKDGLRVLPNSRIQDGVYFSRTAGVGYGVGTGAELYVNLRNARIAPKATKFMEIYEEVRQERILAARGLRGDERYEVLDPFSINQEARRRFNALGYDGFEQGEGVVVITNFDLIKNPKESR